MGPAATMGIHVSARRLLERVSTSHRVVTKAPTEPVFAGRTLRGMERTIDATTTVHAAPGRTRDVLIEDPGTVLTDSHTTEQRRSGRFQSVLTVDIGAGASLQQEVQIEVDSGHTDDDTSGFVLPVRWQATGHERLFPTFAGQLEASPDREGTRLELRGIYTVPLGMAGRFGDGVAGQRLARKSLADFLAHVAKRLDTEVVRRINAPAYHAVNYPVSLSEDGSSPENYVG